MKVFIRTFGCQMNARDSEVVAGLLKKEGFKLVESWEGADVMIFNTCSVRQHAEDKVWSEIGRISKLCKRERKLRVGSLKAGTVKEVRNLGDSPLKAGTVKEVRNLGDSPLKAGTVPIIGLIGCMAQNYKETVFERSPVIDFVAGPGDIDKIPGIIKELLSFGPRAPGQALFERKIWETESEFRPEEIYHTGFYESKEHAYVVISEGCSNYCSYCVVPYVRGNIHHRHHKDIIKEIEEAVARGITKVTLLGQNVNAYKTDIRFVDLIQMVNGIKGVKEFDFITSHPKDTGVELFKAMAGLEKLRKYLHLPAQSGSDRILKLMNRGYTREFYLDLAGKYRKIVKGGLLSTDIIVGFSTEAEKDFLDTRDLVRETGFNCAYIFKYSPRPGTQAANLDDDVPQKEKERRHALILQLQKEISRKNK